LAAAQEHVGDPIAIAFERNGKKGWLVSAATNRLIKVLRDANGTPTINAPTAPLPAGQFSNVVRVEVGKNPTGVVLNSTDTRAYVLNFISRDVSAVDIAAAKPFEKARIESAALPPLNSLAQKILRGHELFNTSIGPAGTLPNSLPPAGRMSDSGWGSCYSCHANGLHDGVTWMFPDGPRQSISMESTFAHPQPFGTKLNASGAPVAPFSDQRVLNWSAVRDEVQDFERNIRLVSGGQGLIDAPITDVFDLVPKANTGRSADLDTLATYIAFGIRAPISPLRNVLLPWFASSVARTHACLAGADSCRKQALEVYLSERSRKRRQ
jgi:hypothetical protein